MQDTPRDRKESIISLKNEQGSEWPEDTVYVGLGQGGVRLWLEG